MLGVGKTLGDNEKPTYVHIFNEMQILWLSTSYLQQYQQLEFIFP